MIGISKSKLKLIKDFALNIGASLMLVGTMNALVYPYLSKTMSADSYGMFLMIIGLLNMLGGTFGNSLNNVRLIMHAEYEGKNISGDFNVLIGIGIGIGAILTIVGSSFFNIDWVYALSITVLSVLIILRNYYSVAFRLKIDYIKNFVFNSYLSISYVLVIIWFTVENITLDYWIGIFLISEIAGLIYLFRNISLFREGFHITELFQKTSKKYITIIYLTLIASMLLYFDRNFLYPLLGGEAVAVYFAATVVGKALCLLTQPISTVMLSYFAQVDFVMNRKKFWQINGAVCVTSFLSYIFTILLVDIIVSFFYPTLYIKAKEYFFIANIVPCLTVIGDMARPAVLKYSSLNTLGILQTSFLIITIGVSYVCIQWNGLYGFCIGSVLLAVMKILTMWALGDYSLRTS